MAIARSLILRFALLLQEAPEIAEPDLNPVRCTTHGCVVLDTTASRAPSPGRARQTDRTPEVRRQRFGRPAHDANRSGRGEAGMMPLG